MVATKKVVHVANLAAEGTYIEDADPAIVAAVELGGVRTALAVPKASTRRRKIITGAKIGGVSQAMKVAQAVRDARGV
jgi:hypothetical protein